MALNTAHAPGGIVVSDGEFILLFCDGVKLSLEGPDARGFKGTKAGRLYLTTRRMVFTNSNSKDVLQSFSFPFDNISDIGLEQPIFSANYIKGTVRAEPNGNWTGQCSFKLTFSKGGAIEFGRALERTRQKIPLFEPGLPPPEFAPPLSLYYSLPPPQVFVPGPYVPYGYPPGPVPGAAPGFAPGLPLPPPYPAPNSAPPPYPGTGPYPPPYPPPYPGPNVPSMYSTAAPPPPPSTSGADYPRQH